MLRSAGPQLVLLAVPFLVLVLLWDKFPARVPIHWGLDGRANGWASKSWGLLLTPVLNVALALLLTCLLPLDKRVRSYGPETQGSLKRVIRTIALATTCFMTGMALLIDVLSLGYKVDVLRVTTLGTLLLLAVLGNYLPKLRPNRFVGIRTPWTLASPEVWNRTHRLFGSIMLIGALALMLPCIILPGPWSLLLMMGFLLGVSFGAMIYSYAVRRG